MISVRCNEQDEQLIKHYAKSNGKTVSELLRELALKKIEDDYDLNLYKAYLKSADCHNTRPIDDLIDELGFTDEL